MRHVSWVLAALLLDVVPVAAQTASVPVALSSSPMTRNADIALAASVLATSATDTLVDLAWHGTIHGDGRKGRIVRAIKLLAFDAPVASYATGLNHEFGHITRSKEHGYRSEFHVVGSPWSGNPFRLYALDFEIFEDLASQIGGEEASRRLKDQSEGAMRESDRITAGHALMVVLPSLDLPVYAHFNLAPDKFPVDGRLFPDGDIGRFVSLLVHARGQFAFAQFDATRRAVRRRSLLNLLDTSLWTLTYGLAHDHVWKGEDGVRVRWLRVGRASVIPSFRYDVTPIGPEYSIRSHYRASRYRGLGYVRWSEHIDGAQQTGVGGSIGGWQVRHLKPVVTGDLWSHTLNGTGLHGALGIDTADWPSRRATFTVTVGAKSSGFLPGFPLDRGAYVTAGFNVRPW